MADPLDPDKPDPEYREPHYDRATDTTGRDTDSPIESAHRRGLITGLVVGVIGGAIVGGIIVGLMEPRTAPTQPAETRDRILGVPEPELRRDDGIERYDDGDAWPTDPQNRSPGTTTPRAAPR